MMKTRLLMLHLASCLTFAQGTIFFKNNRLVHPETGAAYDAFVMNSAGVRVGPEFSASLYLVGAGGELLLHTTSFRLTTRGLLANDYVQVPGVPAGQSATFRVKVWETAAGSYENAVAAGLCRGIFPSVSGDNTVTATLTPAPMGPFPDAQLDGLLPFTLDCIPEPTTFALLALGGLFLLTARKPVSKA